MWPMAVGAALSGAASFFGQRAANAANVRSAREQMAFQERMFNRQVELSNTSVQRHMADLRAAGVNPMLAVLNGSPGAGVPSGGQGARSESRDAAGPAVDRVMQGITSALALKRSKAEIAVLEAQAENLKSSAKTTEMSGMLTQRQRLDIEGADEQVSHAERLRRGQVAGLIGQVHSATRYQDVQRELAELEKPGAENRAKFERDIMKHFGVNQGGAAAIANVLIQIMRMGLGRR